MAIQHRDRYYDTKFPGGILGNNHFTIQQQTLWQEVEKFLQPWLDERQRLIELWHQAVTGALEDKLNHRQVEALCQVLMDYISAGHFEIYEKLLDEAKAFNDGLLSLAETLYEQINYSTEHALRFNELYAGRKNYYLRKRKLPIEIAKLGETLEERFQAEDQLVKFLHKWQH